MKDEAAAYQDALDYLYSFVDYSLTHKFRFSPDKFNLGRMFTLLSSLNDPQREYPVIHIAGTKGKGSTAALVASSYQAAGKRTGLYTSPHLHDYAERIQVSGRQISHLELVELVAYLKPYISQVERLTTFEITTAIAFLYFSRQHVDIAVIEVGLGGRLDATNVVDPAVSIITSLSMDHVDILGDTLAKIAFEKAGIIKAGRPVVLAPQQLEALSVIEAVVQERQSPLFEVGREFQYAAGEHSLAGQSLDVWQTNPPTEAVRLRIPLLGQHQVENAATAYAALLVARQAGLIVPDEAIRRGFETVSWPGRFELLHKDPPFIIDAAHNRKSARRLRQTLDDYLLGLPVVLLFGASEDKDIEGMLAELLPRASRAIMTQSIHPRAMAAEKLAEMVYQSGGPPVQSISAVEDAVAEAIRTAGKDAAVVATGSLFLAAAARDVWFSMVQQNEGKGSVL